MGVWIAMGEAANEVEQALMTAGRPAESSAQALLRSEDGQTFVEITAWPSLDLAETYSVPYVPSAQVYWRRVFELHRAFGSAPLELRAGSSVQWSEFLLRSPKERENLAPLVSGMVGAMAAAGPESLSAIGQLHSVQNTSIGLLGLWKTKDGFKVFERDRTFGSTPYWEPYADNAHWMLGVLRIR